MPFFYHPQHINTGSSSQKTGHEVFCNAIYNHEKRIIYKLNKNANSELSRYEVAFNGLAEQFLQPHLTSPQSLVSDGNTVFGLASEHLCYQVMAREKLEPNFYSITQSSAETVIDKHKANSAEEIPVYFLDQFVPGFFTQLCDLENEGRVTLDIDSLASVLTSSYTLEEDDLHKGNIGFYMVEDNGKPRVVFMKIDHDLMLSESIMAFYNARILNWRHDRHAFAITAKDLAEFPKLSDSRNHYWPTTSRHLTKPSDTKVYSSGPEINAFIDLGTRPDFQKAKWRNFYKHILLPTEVIKDSLTAAYDPTLPADRAQIALITQAVTARQARLRAVLFSMPEFQNFVKEMSPNEQKSLVKEIIGDQPKNQPYKKLLKATFADHKLFCQEKVVEGDTPLHIALKMGDYRYQETWSSFRNFAETKNKQGERPLDVAIKTAQPAGGSLIEDVRQDARFAAKHLLGEGVRETRTYKNLSHHEKRSFVNYRFPIIHLDEAMNATTAKDLIAAIGKIGEDHRFSLKAQKELSLCCVHQFIKTQQANPQLKQILAEFKLALNGRGAVAPNPALQFIRQLRSELWIVRQIRGLLGGTSTQVSLNDVIDKTIRQHSKSSCFSFFGGKEKESTPTAVTPVNSTKLP